MNFVSCDKNLNYQVEKFWKVEGFGTKTTLKTRTDGEADCRHRDVGLSRDDMRAVNILERTTKLTPDNQYEMGLLWIRDDVQLPINRREAKMRLQSLRRKFHKDSSLQEKYRTTIEDYVAKSVPTPEDAITLMEQLIELCAKSGFNRTKFAKQQPQGLVCYISGKES